MERRDKLSKAAEGVYWVYTKVRTGCGISESTAKLVHEFYLDHPGIKRSPMRDDVLKLKDAEGDWQKVPKLLSEVSLTDVYLDFVKMHGEDLIKERAFRYLAPPELRRMSSRHLEMCGCRPPPPPPSSETPRAHLPRLECSA